MKRILSLVIALFLLAGSAAPTFAKPTKARSNVVEQLAKKNQKQVLSEKELFIVMVDVVAEYGEIPASYRYIDIKNSGETPASRLYQAYQKAVYLDILKPSQIPLKFSGQATHKKMVKYTNLFYGVKTDGVILVDGEELRPIEKKLTYDDMLFYASNYLASKAEGNPVQDANGYAELSDAYRVLTTQHIDRDKFVDQELMYGAIQGMAEASGDKFTMFFPPAAAQEFEDEINGEFEGIGAILDLSKPGELMITSVLPKSPAERAGTRGGDRILKIDDFEVVKTTSVDEAVRRIKGAAGTTVALTVIRSGETIVLKITRGKIKMDMVTYQKLDSQTSVIKISGFGKGTTEGFQDAVKQMKADQPKRVLIDLRSNGGGDVMESTNILDYFVPQGENKLTMKTLYSEEVSLSIGLNEAFRDKEIVILVNEGTASASEIVATTIQDYFPKAKVVGIKSYGKGSAQSIYAYPDGSSLKLTTAKWFSGKNKRSVDHVGIKPDHEVELDQEKYRQGIDTQIEFAKSLSY